MEMLTSLPQQLGGRNIQQCSPRRPSWWSDFLGTGEHEGRESETLPTPLLRPRTNKIYRIRERLYGNTEERKRERERERDLPKRAIQEFPALSSHCHIDYCSAKAKDKRRNNHQCHWSPVDTHSSEQGERGRARVGCTGWSSSFPGSRKWWNPFDKSSCCRLGCRLGDWCNQ